MESIMIAFWTILFLLTIIIETVTMGLVSIWFSAGALVALVSAAFGVIFPVQLAIFFIVSGLLLVILFPFVRNKIKLRISPTNADRIIGEDAIVTEAIDPISGSGQIRVLGRIWSAKTLDNVVIEVGEKVVVNSIAGVKAVVVRKEQRL